MKRRTILAVTGASLAWSLGGCLGGSDGAEPGNGTGSPVEPSDEDDGNVSSDAADEVQILVRNRGSDEAIGIEVRRAAETVVTHDASIESGGTRRFDPEISETGEFEVSVSVGDATEAATYEVGDAKLERGSNLLVYVEEGGEIVFGIED